jgi:hypothetical protein
MKSVNSKNHAFKIYVARRRCFFFFENAKMVSRYPHPLGQHHIKLPCATNAIHNKLVTRKHHHPETKEIEGSKE